MILKPGREAEAEGIFHKWGLDFAIIGQTTDTGRLICRHKGEIVADLPVDKLANSAPLYERPWVPTTPPAVVAPDAVKAPNSILGALADMMGSHHLCSRRWIWEQYDHMVMGDTVQRPGGDAAVVRVHGTKKGIAVTCDVTPRYCLADPVMGGRQAVAETWRNLTCVGATPLAITDNMNFGNPERPQIMGQFVGCIEGMREACLTLDYPVVSGNVSLYNETNGQGIPPTPAIGGVGLLPDVAQQADIALKKAGDVLVLIGREQGWLGQSIYQQVVGDGFAGAPPPVDLSAEKIGWRSRARPDPGWHGLGRARLLGRRLAGRRRRNGVGRRDRRDAGCGARWSARARPLVRRRSGALHPGDACRQGIGRAGQRQGAGLAGAGRGHRRAVTRSSFPASRRCR